MPLVHHELCFGCGRTNVFGLLADLDRVDEDTVRGRCFIKQDHQGADLGNAHEGVIAAALSEAMSFTCSEQMRATSLELRLTGPVPIGVFLDLEARLRERSAGFCRATAVAKFEREPVATARATFEPLTQSSAT